MLLAGNSELGLRWIEYHPDFAKPNTKGYLKFYTMSCHATSTRSLAGAVALHHKAPSGAPTECDNVLREWTMDPATMTGKSPREVLRFPQLYTNHGTDALVFDPATKLLYIAVGDGGKLELSRATPIMCRRTSNTSTAKSSGLIRQNPAQPFHPTWPRPPRGLFRFPRTIPTLHPATPGGTPSMR